MASGLVTHSLLRRLPEVERHAAVKDIVQALAYGATAADFQLAISILAECPDDEARNGLADHAHQALINGDFEIVKVICTGDTDLQQRLLLSVVDSLSRTTTYGSENEANAFFAVRPAISTIAREHDFASGHSGLSSATIGYYWRFAREYMNGAASTDVKALLFRLALAHLGASDQSISAAARRTLVNIMTQDGALETQAPLLWSTVVALTMKELDGYYHNLGYGLWLLATALRSDIFHEHHDDLYWRLLQEGLLKGDTERRKQCLGILRFSVRGTALDTRASPSLDPQVQSTTVFVFDEVNSHYERYLTVFETIVLGRYGNQIIACESDLRFLSSEDVRISHKWLYVLLAAAIESSNHKLIGDWIMRDEFQPKSSLDFVAFFRDVFLPWALTGTLFATSLLKQNGEQKCKHGDRLAKYIAFVIQNAFSTGAHYEELIDVILDSLNMRVSNSFGYAAVYVLEGVSQAFNGQPMLQLTSAQVAAIERLVAWENLPEVARDYVKVRCWKLCADASIRRGIRGDNSADVAVHRWEHFKGMLAERRVPGEPVATWNSTLSKRDQTERNTLEKCYKLREAIRGDEKPLLTASDLEASLDDIWSDIEYLEYPKQLLLALPDLVLNPIMIREAHSSLSLATTMRHLIQKLQKLSKNRIYIFSPMISSLVTAVLKRGEAVDLLSVQEFILNYIDNLPIASVDLQLEDATATMLQSISPELKPYGYGHYFGDRLSVGLAALIDFISRIGSVHPLLVRGIFFSILDRWTSQKVPVPSVSPWKSALSLQMLLLCCEQVAPTLSIDEMSSILKNLHYNISIEPMPHLRYALTWAAIRVYSIQPTLQISILEDLTTRDHHKNPKYLAALMRMAVILSKEANATEHFADSLAISFIPLAASSKVVIRHESQWQIPQLMDHAKKQGWQRIIGNKALGAVDAYIRGLDGFVHPPLERQLERFDPAVDHTLTNLVEGGWFNLDDVEQPLCSRTDLLHIEDVYRQAGLLSLPPRCIVLGEAIPRTKKDDTAFDAPPKDVKEVVLAPSRAHESRALQTKGTAYLASQTLEEEHDQRTRGRDIIVIASLVDNPYNLGGISRVAEIFGAKEMHLQNQNVTSNRDFVNVAVSSHLHFPISQLSASAISGFLAEKRDEGYTIVGMEQTNRSVLLGSEACRLPERMVLVIGSERKGIPALILAECDLLVEIPQQGVTRSLNVQTATAIVLFDYARQHG